MNLSGYTLNTERASSVFAKINEVVTPDLDGGLAVFGTVHRFNSRDFDILVVVELR